MQVRHVTHEDILRALAEVNSHFEGNIMFKRCEFAGNTRQGTGKYTVTLKPIYSAAAGGRRSRDGRRIAAACWHVYGTFRDALPEHAEVVTDTAKGRCIESPGDPWVDWNIGNRYMPFMYSDACLCEEEDHDWLYSYEHVYAERT